MIRILLLISLLSLTVPPDAGADSTEERRYITGMKENARGPFKRLRWFCNDGSVLPPKPYACSKRGGGVQHGEYSKMALKVREAGYPIATLLADLVPADVLDVGDHYQLLNSMLLERFLVSFDDGWIFRKAQFYRGAVQAEDEQRSGQAILEAMYADDRFLRTNFFRARESVRLLPHNRVLISLSDVRGLAASIADQDGNFRALRGKIHGRPDAADAARVREYARTQGVKKLRPHYQRLAQLIDDTYAASTLPEVLETLQSTVSTPALRRQIANALSAPSDTGAKRHLAANEMIAHLRSHLLDEPDAVARISMMDASIELERIAFVAGRDLLANTGKFTRAQTLRQLASAAHGLYGAGLITQPEMDEIKVVMKKLSADNPTLDRYRKELAILGRVSEWADRQLHFNFGATIEHWMPIEPLVDQYVPDRLRGSSLLIFQELHDRLALDAQHVSGIKHELFGEPASSGLRSLNPGIVRGPLYFADHNTKQSEFKPHGIYVVPETLPRIPPVAGILTRSEGNALSHVQLLARNLGIPNIVISDDVEQALRPHEGKTIVIAASRGGVVRIAHNAFQWDNVFRGDDTGKSTRLEIDASELDLERRSLYALKDLRSSDSGRVVGPKAAKLGELLAQFPGHVSAGIAIPFGVYRALLEQPVEAGSTQTMRNWMAERYRYLAKLQQSKPRAHKRQLAETLEFIRSWIKSVPLPAGLEDELRQLMRQEFGREGQYGVFVRSDTNVEDLPNFSGAGLNLTVPHVVGFERTIDAIRRVWASPFTERAFAWRQALMDQPEHVYASVLLQVGVAADKSGVMVTKDLATGNPDVATVVVNLGVGGGVDGQLAESLRINVQNGEVRRMSSATAHTRTVLLPTGGADKEVVTNSEVVLSFADIQKLRQLAQTIPQRMEEFRDSASAVAPAADVEFGFLDDKLWLFQIRPFVESGAQNLNRYLIALDAGLAATAKQRMDLNQVVTEVKQ